MTELADSNSMTNQDSVKGRQDTRIYFDAAASALVDPACREALAQYDSLPWAGANPNSLHSYGRAAFALLEDARRDLARSLGASRPSEIIFTSGGTESNNLALLGMTQAVREKSGGKKTRVLMSAVEHDSVLAMRSRLKADGFITQTIPVNRDGILDIDALHSMLSDDVALISVMTVNNEVGTLQPVKQVVEAAHSFGALVHTDAVQALGKTVFNVRDLGVDAASVTAHKLGGPVGIGALYVRSRTPIRAIQMGGGQESGLRSGTVDVRGAFAFAAVARAAADNLAQRSAQVQRVSKVIEEDLTQGETPCAELAAQVSHAQRVPGTLCLLIKGKDSQSLVIALDDRGFEVSGGSACAAGSRDPSHVLLAMGIPRDLALGELRISFDYRTTEEQAQGLVQAVREVCQ